jgi:hypothetical protein
MEKTIIHFAITKAITKSINCLEDPFLYYIEAELPARWNCLDEEKKY